jgi:hypothetical protein
VIFENANAFANINTPEELKALEEVSWWIIRPITLFS